MASLLICNWKNSGMLPSAGIPMNSRACASDMPRAVQLRDELVDERLGGRDTTRLEGVDNPGLHRVLETADHPGQAGVEPFRRRVGSRTTDQSTAPCSSMNP